MNSLFSNPLPDPKPTIASPFFMFLSDQQKATKAQNTDIKLLDLAFNAIREWDQVMSIQDEYTAKFFEESEKIVSGAIPNLQASLPAQPEIKFAFDSKGNPVPPKRPLTAFFLFKEDCFAQVKRENPTAKITDITKIISRRWMEVDQQTKEYYARKHEQVKVLYVQQMALFEATYGKIEKKTTRRVNLEGSSLFQMNHPNPAESSDSDE